MVETQSRNSIGRMRQCTEGNVDVRGGRKKKGKGKILLSVDLTIAILIG